MKDLSLNLAEKEKIQKLNKTSIEASQRNEEEKKKEKDNNLDSLVNELHPCATLPPFSSPSGFSSSCLYSLCSSFCECDLGGSFESVPPGEYIAQKNPFLMNENVNTRKKQRDDCRLDKYSSVSLFSSEPNPLPLSPPLLWEKQKQNKEKEKMMKQTEGSIGIHEKRKKGKIKNADGSDEVESHLDRKKEQEGKKRTTRSIEEEEMNKKEKEEEKYDEEKGNDNSAECSVVTTVTSSTSNKRPRSSLSSSCFSSSIDGYSDRENDCNSTGNNVNKKQIIIQKERNEEEKRKEERRYFKGTEVGANNSENRRLSYATTASDTHSKSKSQEENDLCSKRKRQITKKTEEEDDEGTEVEDGDDDEKVNDSRTFFQIKNKSLYERIRGEKNKEEINNHRENWKEQKERNKEGENSETEEEEKEKEEEEINNRKRKVRFTADSRTSITDSLPTNNADERQKKRKAINGYINRMSRDADTYDRLCVNHLYDEGFRETAGKIKVIKLKNFLIHKNLVFVCSPYANLVIGRNGQGKSAIAQAVAICCGVEGRKAGRNTQLFSYIKDYFQPDGPASAEVTIHFSNEGPNAYKPEIFGSEIILTRIIRRRGGGEYRLRGTLNKFYVGDKKGDVSDYLDSAHIDVESPVVYLSQEWSKNLLNSNKPNALYDFFYKSVGLERCDKLLLTEKEMLDEAQNQMEIHWEALKPKLQKTEDLCAKLKKIESLAEAIRKAALLEVYEKYAQLEALKNAHKSIENDENTAQGFKEMIQKNRQEVIKKIKELEDVRDNLLEERKKLREEIIKTRENFNECSDQFKVIKENADLVWQKHKSAKESIKKIEKQIEELENEKKEAEEKMKFDYSGEIEQLQKSIERCTKEKEKIVKMMEEAADEKETLEEQVKKIVEEKDSLQKELKSVEAEEEVQISTIKFYQQKAKSQNKVSVRKYLWSFDLETVTSRLRALTSRGEFSAMPVGPLGEFLKINEKYTNGKIYDVHKIAFLVERHLKPHLNKWLVATHNDRLKLIDLLRQYGCLSPEITVVSKFGCGIYEEVLATDATQKQTEINVPPPPPPHNKLNIPHDLLTIFKCLEKENPVVINYLIDTASIEKVCICKTFSELHLYLNDTKLKINSGYDLEEALFAKRVGWGLEAPQQHKGFHNFKYVQLHTTDPLHDQESIRKTQQNLNETRKSKANIQNQIQDLNLQISKIKKSIIEVKEKENKIRVKRNKLMAEFDVDNAALSETQALQASQGYSNFDAFDEEILGMKKKVAANEEKIKELEEELNKLEEEKNKKKDERNEMAERGKALLQQVEAIDQSGKEEEKGRASLEAKKKEFDLQIKTKNDEIAKLRKKKEDAASHIEKFEEVKLLPPLNSPVDKTAEEYKEERMNAKNRYLAVAKTVLKNAEEQDLEDEKQLQKRILEEFESLRVEYERALGASSAASADYRQVKLNYRTQHRNFHHRTHTLGLTKNCLGTKAAKIFGEQLKEVLNFDGSFTLDHEKGILNILVCNNNFNKEKTNNADMSNSNKQNKKKTNNPECMYTTDTKSLSGGERSSVQLAFLTAMAKGTHSPFHIFDELDVYMDDLNRIKNMEKIFEFSRSERDRQFFFITPHYEVKKFVMQKFSDLVRVFDLSEEKNKQE